MSGSIRLHSELGVNPRLVKNECVACHQMYDLNELVLMGSSNKKFVCKDCGKTSYGSNCCLSDKYHNGKVLELGEFEHIVAGKFEMCPECVKKFVIVLHIDSDNYAVLPRESINITIPEDGIMQTNDEGWNYIINMLNK